MYRLQVRGRQTAGVAHPLFRQGCLAKQSDISLQPLLAVAGPAHAVERCPSLQRTVVNGTGCPTEAPLS